MRCSFEHGSRELVLRDPVPRSEPSLLITLNPAPRESCRISRYRLHSRRKKQKEQKKKKKTVPSRRLIAQPNTSETQLEQSVPTRRFEQSWHATLPRAECADRWPKANKQKEKENGGETLHGPGMPPPSALCSIVLVYSGSTSCPSFPRGENFARCYARAYKIVAV